MIIAVVNTKGGSGKSTTATQLSVWLASGGLTVLLVDTDKQSSSVSWTGWRRRLEELRTSEDPLTEEEEAELATYPKIKHLGPTPVSMQLFGQAVLNETELHAKNYDVTVIDTKGTDSSGMRAALSVCDLAIVPLRDGDFDKVALSDLFAALELINSVRKEGQKVNIRAFLNQMPAYKTFPYKLMDDLEAAGLNPFGRIIKHREIYSKASKGVSIFEIGTDEKAMFETEMLFKDIVKEIENAKK